MADIRDIARLAGVSPATVSRVMNDHPHVSGATRARVLAVAEDLHYRPAARRFAAGQGLGQGWGQSDLVAYLHFGAPALADGRMAEAAETVLFEAGYKTFVCNAGGDPERERFYLDQIAARHVAGAILSPQGQDDRAQAAARQLAEAGVRSVLLNPGRMLEGVSLAALDPRQGWALGWAHLHAQGARRILCLAEPHQPVALPDDLPNMPAPQVLHLAPGPDRLAALDPAPWSAGWDAIFCGSEQIAVEVLRRLQQEGRRVPDDISVLAMGGSDVARMLVPRLTVVGLPLEELARLSAELLLSRIRTPDGAVRKLLLESRLIEGGTTGLRKT